MWRLMTAVVLVSAPASAVWAQPATPSAPSLDQRVARLERMLEGQALMDLFARLEQLRSEMQQLRGQIEEVNHEVDGAKQRQRDLYLDLDRRLSQLEKSIAGLSTKATAVGEISDVETGGQNSAVERAAYQQAFDLLKDKRYDEAINAFRGFVSQFPNGELTANAYYWLGETYYVTRRFSEAITEFGRVVNQFPSSNKAPDAMLKLGYTYYDQGNWAQARLSLETLKARYPDANAAALADKRLQKMRAEGH